jgi:hypothetical protein
VTSVGVVLVAAARSDTVDQPSTKANKNASAVHRVDTRGHALLPCSFASAPVPPWGKTDRSLWKSEMHDFK